MGGGIGVGVGCSVGAGVGVGVGVAVGVGLGAGVAEGVGFGAVDGAGEAGALGAGDGDDEPCRARMATMAISATAMTPIRTRSHVCMRRSGPEAPPPCGDGPGDGGGPCGGKPSGVGRAGSADAADPVPTAGGGGTENTSVGGRGAGPGGLGDPGVREGPLISDARPQEPTQPGAAEAGDVADEAHHRGSPPQIGAFGLMPIG